MINESKAQGQAAEAAWVESIRLEAKAAIVTIDAFQIATTCDDLLPQPKESK